MCMIPDLVTNIDYDQSSCVESTVGDYLVVSLRGRPNDFNKYPFEDEHVASMAAILDDLVLSMGLSVHFLPFHGHGERDDNRLHCRIINKMKCSKDAVLHEWSSDVKSILSIFYSAKAVVGMRLHSVVLSVALNKKCVSMPYDNKVEQYCDLMNVKSRLSSEDLLNIDRSSGVIKDCIMHDCDYNKCLLSEWNNVKLD